MTLLQQELEALPLHQDTVNSQFEDPYPILDVVFGSHDTAEAAVISLVAVGEQAVRIVADERNDEITEQYDAYLKRIADHDIIPSTPAEEEAGVQPQSFESFRRRVQREWLAAIATLVPLRVSHAEESGERLVTFTAGKAQVDVMITAMDLYGRSSPPNDYHGVLASLAVANRVFSEDDYGLTKCELSAVPATMQQ
jgi:hypothetical protein